MRGLFPRSPWIGRPSRRGCTLCSGPHMLEAKVSAEPLSWKAPGRSPFQDPSCRTEVPTSAPASCPPPRAPVTALTPSHRPAHQRAQSCLSLPSSPPRAKAQPSSQASPLPGRCRPSRHSEAGPLPALSEKHSELLTRFLTRTTLGRRREQGSYLKPGETWSVTRLSDSSDSCGDPRGAQQAPSPCLPADRTRGICTSGDESLTWALGFEEFMRKGEGCIY